ncbi:MAG: hypothetical protein IJ107_03460, partial [Lachnospiraceae bacterium]|nr:hypothetical protein [Lachnospiraceae bacterium]
MVNSFDPYFNSNGWYVPDCPLCNPSMNKKASFETNILETAKRYFYLSGLAYDTDEWAKNKKAINPVNQLRIDHTRYSDSADYSLAAPDCLIETNMSEDGKLVLTLAFEGSSGEDPTIIKSFFEAIKNPDDEHKHLHEESYEDWASTDFVPGQNDKGIHKGIDRAYDRLMSINDKIPMPSPVLESITTLGYKNTLSDLIRYAANTPDKSIIQTTGHSLGGALAQVFAYHMISDYGIQKEQVYAYTFASFVPFTNAAISGSKFDDLNVYNFINVRDFVPKYGVTQFQNRISSLGNVLGSELRSGIEMALYQLGNKNVNPGGFVFEGSNLGWNVYLEGPPAATGLSINALTSESVKSGYTKLVPETGISIEALVSEHVMDGYTKLMNGLGENGTTTYKFTNTREKKKSWLQKFSEKLKDSAWLSLPLPKVGL